MSLRTTWQLIRETIGGWNKHKDPRLAAALSYYSMFSLAPMLVIAIAVASVAFGREAAEGELVGQIEGLIGREGAQAVQALVGKTWQHHSGWLPTILGLVTLMIGATGVFAQLQDALDTIWEVTPRPDRGWMLALRQRLLSFALVLGIGFLLLVSLILSAGLAAVGKMMAGFLPAPALVMQLVTDLISLAVITLLFAAIFKVLPDVDVTWKDVWIGASATSLLFAAGKFLIGLYLGKSSVTSAFGAAGSVVILLIWVYYSSCILFLGAEFTRAFARRHGSNPGASEHAVPLTKAARLAQGMPSARETAALQHESDKQVRSGK